MCILLLCMRTLGIDGGFTRLGLGVVDSDGTDITLVTHGLIFNPRADGSLFNDHLNAGISRITNDFPRFLDLTRPDVIYGETIPAGRLGANDSLVIAAVTTCKVIAFQFGIAWHDIAASTVKKELTGDGRATKTVVRDAIFDLFPVVQERHALLKQEQKDDGEKPTGLPQDVIDGLAIAVVGAKKNAKAKEVQELQ
jgi:Holliday junction resolvasome RuvABC endonuclease subunit